MHVVRQLIAAPLTWGVLCFAVSAIWLGEGFVPFLLLLVAGWCVGHAIVRCVERVSSAAAQLAWYIGLSAAFVVVGMIVWPRWGEILGLLPSPARTVAYLLGMTSLTTVGWVWLATLGHITARVTTSNPVRNGPEWEVEAGVRVLHLRAVPVPHRRLTIAAAVAAGSGAAMALAAVVLWAPLINGGPKLLVLLMGIVGLPIYEWRKRALRAETTSCAVRILPRSLRVVVGDKHVDIAYRDIEEFVWCATGENARVEITGRGIRRCLLVGIARQEPAIAATLPPLSGRFRQLLVTNGLAADSRQERRGTTRFVRRPLRAAPDGRG
jgi:hypothetical protein